MKENHTNADVEHSYVHVRVKRKDQPQDAVVHHCQHHTTLYTAEIRVSGQLRGEIPKRLLL